MTTFNEWMTEWRGKIAEARGGAIMTTKEQIETFCDEVLGIQGNNSVDKIVLGIIVEAIQKWEEYRDKSHDSIA